MKTKKRQFILESAARAISGQRRRGSFLVLVVGTLAMLSIIMIVYVAVGSSDKRTSASIVRRDRSEDVVSQFSDYLAQIVADDAVTAVPDTGYGKGLVGGDLFLREAWDAPTTNWRADSTTALKNTADPLAFRAVGIGDDPWLASTTPTWLNYNPDPNAPDPTQADGKIFAKRRDWLHISNIAPDGRFVNLFNLKDNFEAKPGTLNTPGNRRMNADLSLLDATSGPVSTTVWGETVSPDKPAFFDSWQQGAFRPARGPFSPNLLKASNNNEKNYPPYQWADTDGDGFFDARWFEMTDARGDTNSSTPTKFNNLLAADPNYRWFFAARIVDLSALVNVNTAGDLAADPNVTGLASSAMPRKFDVGGIAPSDVDLRKLLQMRDFDEVVRDGSAQPIDISDVAANGSMNASARKYYGGYSGLRQPISGSPSQDYSKYLTDIATSPTGPITNFAAVTKPAADLGEGGYRSLRGSLGVSGATGRFSNFAADGPLKTAAISFPTGRDRSTFYDTLAAPMGRALYDSTNSRFLYSTGVGIDSLVELLTFRGVNDNRVTSALELILGGHFSSGMNAEPQPTDPQNPFGPLRENRSTELERESLADRDGNVTDAAMLRSLVDVRQYLTTLSGARPIVPATLASTAGTNIDLPPDLVGTSDLSIYIGENSINKSPDVQTLFKSGYVKALLPGLSFYSIDPGNPVEVWKDVKTDPDSKALRGTFYGGQGPMTALLAAAHMSVNMGAALQTPANKSSLPKVLVLAEEAYMLQNDRLPRDLTNPSMMGWKSYFPAWWQNASNHLNLAREPEDRLPASTVRPSLPAAITSQPVPAVNVYNSSDPFPVIVEAASFTLYRDQPPNLQAKDGTPFGNTEHYTDVTSPITQVQIKGNIEESNHDLLFRAFVVKLHNPHSIPIELSKLTSSTVTTSSANSIAVNNGADGFFYVRIGSGSDSFYYVLADCREIRGTDADGEYDGNFRIQALTINPGETIAFYALSEAQQTIVVDRVNFSTRVLGNVSPLPEKSGRLMQEWLDKQIGKDDLSTENAHFRRIQMVRVEDAKFGSTGTPTLAGASFAFSKLVPAFGSDQSVSLCRSVKTDSGAGVGNDQSSANLVANDQICDRLRLDSATACFDRQLINSSIPTTQQDYATAVIGLKVDELGDGPGQDVPRPGTPGRDRERRLTVQPNYNSRFTVMLCVDVRRKSEVDGAKYKVGMIPAWAIDPKEVHGTDPWYLVTNLPAQGANSAPFQLSATGLDFGTDQKISWQTSTLWKDAVENASAKPVFETLAQHPTKWTDNTIPPNYQGVEFSDMRRELSSNMLRYQGYDATTKLGDGISQLRPVDMLNVLAVGSIEVPVMNSGTEITNPAARWTTLAEGLAAATNYAKRPDPTLVTDWNANGVKQGPLDYYYFDLFGSSPTDTRNLFESGYLRVDDFVPVRYDTAGKAYTVGVGAPIATNVLTMFRNRPDSQAGLTVAVPGLININTAPSAVLRVLPMTFPSTDPITDTTFWVGSDEPTRKLEALKTDIAAMIESYRDKIAVPLRPKARKGPDTSALAWFAGFFDRSKASITTAGDQDVDPNDPKLALGEFDPLQAAQTVGGRYWSNGIRNIREDAGFRSIGELSAVKQIEFTAATGAVSTTAADLAKRTSNIDFLGSRDVGSPTNLLGFDNILKTKVDTDGKTVLDATPLEFGHTYQDKLKVLAGILGSVSVRSDMYAAWFVVRGYQRSDVEGLMDGQPMVPSVERRFLMIIDRSNVTKVGQKPRVLAFVEVPL